MDQNKAPSYLLVVIGVGLLAASLLADATGIGSNPGFGPRQTVGSVVGALILVLGLYYLRKK